MNNEQFYKDYIATKKAWPELQTKHEIIFEYPCGGDGEHEPALNDFVISKIDVAKFMFNNGKTENDIKRFFANNVRIPNGAIIHLMDEAVYNFLKSI